MFVREHTRYAVELAIRMKCATWADYLELHTSNLSRGGLFVPSQLAAPVGAELAIELTLPNGALVRLRGEVAHVTAAGEGQPAGLGVMFVGVDDEARGALEEALKVARAQAPKPPPPPLPPPPLPTANERKAPVAPPPVTTANERKAPVAPPPVTTANERKAPVAPPPLPRVPRFADAVEHALVDELARRLDLPPHEQLGVTAEVGDAELEEAHRHLKERYAPSIFARYGSSTAATVKSINDAIDQAYRRLRDPSQRRALVIAAHQPKAAEPSPAEQEQRRRGEEARAALRASIERRVEEACAHRDMNRIDDAVRVFEQVLGLDRKHEYARAELTRLRDLKGRKR